MKRKKISPRQKEIILLLAQNASNKPITISEVAKELNISTRTVLRDMTKIESWLDENDFKFIKKPGVGIYLDETLDSKQFIIELLQEEKIEKSYTKEERKKFILSNLLTSSEPIKSYYFYKTLKISEGTLNNDFIEIEEWLDNFSIKLIRKPGTGIYVEGSEKDMRSAQVRLIYNSFEEQELTTMQKKSIYVAYTGGTIGMQRSEHGYVPVSGHLQRQLALMPEFHRPEMPDFTIHEYHPLMDSSDMTPEDWQHIADDIRSHYEEYDGFVILHGTDTMAFTASALSFMLENLGKPVIVTGSQIPLAELRSDGQINLLNALYVAANYPINEVALFFNNRLFRGNRTTKAHADGFDAFASPNLAPLLEAGIHIRRLGTPPAPQGSGELIVHPITPQPIGVVTIYPGISADVVRNFLRQPVKALILRSYGVGNAPQNGEFIQVLAEASQRGIVVVNLTQCMSGKVNMGGYATGNALAQAGVISGFDMTVEATLTKLHYLLSQQLDVDAIRAAMQQNLRGELTPDEA